MATKWNTLRSINVLVWTLFFVVISSAENSGDMAFQNIFAVKGNGATTDLYVDTTTTAAATTTEISTLITKLTSSQKNLTTDQSSTVKDYVTTSTLLAETTTLLAETTTLLAERTTLSDETTTLPTETTTKRSTEASVTVPDGEPTKDKQNEDDMVLLTRLNGYKIATFCLAAILGVIFLIILIYFSTKSKTGHGEITCPPETPPLDVEDYPKEEEPQVVRLSSYFPYADTLPKDDIHENGVVDDRRVTTFLTKKNKIQDASGSQDKILHTSEL